ncbi:MAG: hypothetical protein LBN33_10355 [Desulfovibrio sp.]|jgi:hypothetical protein|nr:hypothetical protein [Desulfovibrio sp.]
MSSADESSLLSVPAHAVVMFRKDSRPQRLYGGAAPPASLTLREEFLSSRTFPDPAARFLVELDRKVDAILSLLQREVLQNDFPHSGRALRLGASGLILDCEAPLAPGIYLELLLFLSECPERILAFLARVDKEIPLAVFAAEYENEEFFLQPQSGHVYELSFLDMESEEREGLIRFVFAQERRRIRRRRETE